MRLLFHQQGTFSWAKLACAADLLLLACSCRRRPRSSPHRVHSCGEQTSTSALSGRPRQLGLQKRCGGKLSLLPAELLVLWRLSTYQSLREKHIFMRRQRQQGHNFPTIPRGHSYSLVPLCMAGATGAAAPLLPTAAPLLRTTNDSAAISAVWADMNWRQDTQCEWCVFCPV